MKDLAAQLNRDCLCRTLDAPRLAQALGLAPEAAALAASGDAISPAAASAKRRASTESVLLPASAMIRSRAVSGNVESASRAALAAEGPALESSTSATSTS